MGMDRNTVIGFVLIGALLIAMFVINSRSNQAFLTEKKRVEDSIAAAKPKVDPVVAKKDSIVLDSILAAKQKLPAAFITDTTEHFDTLENDLLKIVFTNKGGQPKTVELKKFKKFDGRPLILENGKFNKLSYLINTGNNQTKQTADIAFVSSSKTVNASKTQSVSFVLKDSTGKEITHQYTLQPASYMVDFNISMTGADKLVSQNTINLLWQTEAPQIESDIKYERQQSHLGYLKDGSNYDFEYIGSGDDKKFEKPVEWLAVKQQFFIAALSAKSKFQSAFVKWVVPDDSLHIISQTTANCNIQLAGSSAGNTALQLYYGPSDYNVLSTYNNQMENIVPYGSGVFAFVKYINRHFLLPVFDFLRNHIASMGMVILLLTLLIRLITSPILYKSYLSGAKMKALKPEIDRLKEKHGDDKQAFSMDQMKLWKSAGVSPLGGCLPALLQIPIFMSLYYFFQSNISLRGESFLWAKDLAAYDSIASLPFSIPFYGDHVSLFTITATVTSLIISIYSMSNMQDNSNPVMKYMPYIFPVLLLGVFNNLPAALTWYYTVSNTITLILQIVIQKYIINHEKILAQIEENRKKPVKQSKFQERMMAMQESNKKLQDMKKKSGKN
ncbi:MAG: membrane protein insertase YidC [Chitinophagaceae bacterium]|nr:membrane protein insertase YidC [Chitinophagaceae bacterium]MBK9485447.1 membrane protein insertase YidC [Chitinophagaceae bacterium]